MGEFPEPVKREVRKRAAFQCCRCRSFGIEVHHIIPTKDDGTDDIDNAAPLCPNCHSSFGDNPQKRKEIREMRDCWYERVEKMFRPNIDFLAKIDQNIQYISQNQDEQSQNLNELKGMLRSFVDNAINGITPATAATTASNIVNASAVSSVRLGENVHADVVCHQCNTRVGLLVGRNTCPGCGASLQ